MKIGYVGGTEETHGVTFFCSIIRAISSICEGISGFFNLNTGKDDKGSVEYLVGKHIQTEMIRNKKEKGLHKMP